MNVTKETVTPKKAMEWLKRNINNRPLSQGWIDQLARAMTDKAATATATAPSRNGSAPKQERAVFTKLRALFDEMSDSERQQAAMMWSDWLDSNDPETPLWGEQNKE